MHLVAFNPPASPDASLPAALAERTGMSLYDTKSRLRVLAGWPGILGHYGEEGLAEAIAAAVRGLGLTAWVMPGAPHELRSTVRRFSLSGGMMSAIADGGVRHEVELSSIHLGIAGQRYAVRNEATVDRGGPKATVIGAAFGFPTASSPTVSQRRTETREGFVHLYAVGHPTLVFSEPSVQYAAVQAGIVEPTRRANFTRVMRQLQSVCTRATWDERLWQRRVQARLLGPVLPPERHLDVAIALLSRQLGAADDPYR